MSSAVAGHARAGEAAQLFRALADETRLAILALLARTDLRSGEIVARLDMPQNVISYHLKQLRGLGILRDRRSHADARDIYYSLDVDHLQALYARAGQTMHPALVPAGNRGAHSLTGGPLRVLFVCTHNSARSQIAEAVLRLRGGDGVEEASAGTQPTAVHPMTVALLAEHGVDPSRHTAKSLDAIAGRPFDEVITVCDSANDDCPAFPDAPWRTHWSLPDPAAIDDPVARWDAFERLWADLDTRVRYWLALPHDRPTTTRSA